MASKRSKSTALASSSSADPRATEPKTELVERPRDGISAARRLRALEDDILEDATRIVRGVMAFDQIDPGWEDAPREWVERYGEVEATQRFRMAKYGLMSRRDAPIAITVAQQTHQAITKARSVEKAGPRVFNMNLVSMPAAELNFPTLELEEGQR